MIENELKKIKSKKDADKFVALLKDSAFSWELNTMDDNECMFMCREIRQKAKEVGEIKLWNEFERANINKSSKRTGESNVYFCQETNQRYDVGPWMVSDVAIIKTYNDMEVYAAYQPIIITKRFINIEDDTEKFELAYLDNGKWRRKIIPRTMLSSASSVSKLVNYGISIAPSNANNFCNYINDFYNLNIAKIETVQSVSRLGWIGNDFKSFLPYTDSSIVCDSEGEFKKIIEYFKANGNEKEWIEETANARKNFNVRLYMAASFASPLIKMLGINGFLVHLYGDRGKGKTVSLMLAMSIWGNPNLGKLTNSINNTMFATECRAEFLQNLPFSGDELQNIDTREINNDALIYMVSNGSGKGRGDKEGNLKRQSSWGLTMLTTGEIPITDDTSRSGCKVRCIEIENNAEMYSDIDLMQFAESIKQNYGFAGKKFIDYIIEIGKVELSDRFEKVKKSIASETRTKLDAKQLNNVAALKLADDLAVECIFKNELPLTSKVMMTLVKDEDEINVAIRAWNFVMSEILREAYYFDDENDSEEVKKEKKAKRNKTNGKINFVKKEVYINLNCLKEYLRKGSYSFDMVKEKWANERLITTYKARNKYYTRYKEYGTVVKFINCFDNDEEIINNMADYYEEPPF